MLILKTCRFSSTSKIILEKSSISTSLYLNASACLYILDLSNMSLPIVHISLYLHLNINIYIYIYIYEFHYLNSASKSTVPSPILTNQLSPTSPSSPFFPEGYTIMLVMNTKYLSIITRRLIDLCSVIQSESLFYLTW